MVLMSRNQHSHQDSSSGDEQIIENSSLLSRTTCVISVNILNKFNSIYGMLTLNVNNFIRKSFIEMKLMFLQRIAITYPCVN